MAIRKKSWRDKFQVLKGGMPISSAAEVFDVELDESERWHPETECFICGEELDRDPFVETKPVENPLTGVTQEHTFKYHRRCFEQEGGALDRNIFEVITDEREWERVKSDAEKSQFEK